MLPGESDTEHRCHTTRVCTSSTGTEAILSRSKRPTEQGGAEAQSCAGTASPQGLIHTLGPALRQAEGSYDSLGPGGSGLSGHFPTLSH